MKGSVRRLRARQRQLLRLYSLWQETKREDVQRQFLRILGGILAVKPGFNLFDEFKKAF
ncbi:MAG: hypothetical protein HYZ83_08740 [Candidatus Omnitrophica bacterium]|nr:hypothetical protein [Candidatus Omnitrophota bacterium]